ncbi:hypothetical protein AWH62_12560 [Maricaulis sp. W15]|uniref:hypothetical protein n=1 Tax=Maricaulis sp. W15 TaxID=1772333 RepID=UPI000948BD0D|nr:hypothetical protein [Maricaulis sp. W15]OLF71376.1 hypothetical protein AWH62_12560 [Maricaulis sp. W15]
MKLKLMTGAAMAAMLAIAPAHAIQDPNAAPAYGSSDVNAGFVPDPLSVGLRAGGAMPASEASEWCPGFVSYQPSYNLNYDAGSFDLYLSAASDVDTVLLVNAPDGSWHCDDDGAGSGLNAGMLFEAPQSGVYNIWVGTFGSGGGYEPAMLHISELGFEDDNPYSQAPSADLPPEYGTLSLSEGFANDPRTLNVEAGGPVELDRFADGMCWGQADQAPDLWVDYAGSDTFDLYVSMQSDSDTTLAVQAPDGAWHCDDDSAENLNPGVQIRDPLPGRYAVWTARYSSNQRVPATVYVSELGFLGMVDEPAVLDYSLPSQSGSVSLDAGFVPDPYNVDVMAGGDTDVYEAVGESCRGWADSAPDFDLNYQAGDFDLYLSATSDSDATLIVNAPDGSWHCDDDSAGELNPGLVFDEPMSGRYDIWVGTYGEYDAGPATLHISELGFGGGFLPETPLDYSLPANYADVELSGGFVPDPYLVELMAGGDVEAESAADRSCRGFVTLAPDVELTFEPGGLDLYISAVSDRDTTLVINGPDGEWYCNDDGAGNFNPGVRFIEPQAGVYDIWVGTYSSGPAADAVLAISELGFHED